VSRRKPKRKSCSRIRRYLEEVLGEAERQHAGLTLLPLHTWYSLLRPGPGSPMVVSISTSRPPAALRPPKIKKQTCAEHTRRARPAKPSGSGRRGRRRRTARRRCSPAACYPSRIRFGGFGVGSWEEPRRPTAANATSSAPPPPAVALIGLVVRQRGRARARVAATRENNHRGRAVGGGLTTAACRGRPRRARLHE